MKFGSREIANVVFRAKSQQRIGNTMFQKGQPVLYIDTATASTVEGAATSVYAQGGRGNTRLVTWEGEKTLTFTVEDALLSPIGLAILSGAGLWKGTNPDQYVHVHTMSADVLATESSVSGAAFKVDLADALVNADSNAAEKHYQICADAPIFAMLTEDDGSITGDLLKITGFNDDFTTIYFDSTTVQETALRAGMGVMIDYYMLQPGTNVEEIQIDADKFAGYFYVEAETLFRRQADGVDMPANLTFPNVKIQSNFSFSMSASGDPSTFSFTMDAMPDYTYFDRKHKVLCAIQIINGKAGTENPDTVMGHDKTAGEYNKDESKNDSYKSNTSANNPTERN